MPPRRTLRRASGAHPFAINDSAFSKPEATYVPTVCLFDCQMPRGNLEVVEPRSLVLASVADALDTRNYSSAWQIARQSRLDLNVIVDYDFEVFLAVRVKHTPCRVFVGRRRGGRCG